MSDDFSLNPEPPKISAGLPKSIPKNFGQFRLERPLGRGAMAKIILATDTLRNEKVAIKIPTFKEGGDSERVRGRFQREARAIATLSHPNICPIYDVGVIDNILYLSMPYVEGYSLADLLKRSQRFSETQVARIVRDTALAVEEAHQNGILHRDLKPSNIMITSEGKVVVLDFGLARFLDDEIGDDTFSTLAGHTVGTPTYMSPEQTLADENLTPASDVFSLGVTMWELLVGNRPFTGDPLKIMQEVVYSERYPTPREVQPNLSVEMDAICMKAMSKQVEGRYKTMKELARVLQNRLEGKKVSVAIPIVEDSPPRRTSEPPTLAETKADISTPSKSRSRSGGSFRAKVQRPPFPKKASMKPETAETRTPSKPIPWIPIGIGVAILVILAIVFALW